MHSTSAKVILIEDHPRMRTLMSRSLGAQGLALEGAFETAEAALERLGEGSSGFAPDLAPDLAIVDISLPGMSGIEFVRELHNRVASCYCLMLSGHSGLEYVLAAKRAGARGFVPKDQPDDLFTAITRVLAGEQYWPMLEQSG